MGCSSCGSGAVSGCGSKGSCNTGSCNRLSTYDWISSLDIYDPTEYNIVEVSFKNGSRKDFFIKEPHVDAVTGEFVVVSTSSGSDLGTITLSGELVRAQMKKKRAKEDRVTQKILRLANERDMEKLREARSMEQATLVKARVIARTHGLDMKIGDVEYQGDKRKVTIYYTAEGRVDFRELVKSYVKEFRVKIEMKQIGARQESAMIGGIGSCGRELCCSTWLSDFKSVNTSAARYQNIAINQAKLSGQCGRLKCCLNYELESYMDALKDFPEKADYIRTKKGKASLIKTDIFKGLMFYAYVDRSIKGGIVSLTKERVKEIQAMNKKGEFPEDLEDYQVILEREEQREKEIDFADVTGQIELPNTKRKKRRNKRKKPSNRNTKGGENTPKPNTKSDKDTKQQSQAKPKQQKPQPQNKQNAEGGKDGRPKSRNNRNKRRNYRKKRPNNTGEPKSDNAPKNDK